MSSNLALMGLCLAAAATGPLHRYEAVEPHMGTMFRIELYAADEQTAKAAFAAAFSRIGELDATLSDYQTTSELSRLSAHSGKGPVTVGEDLFEVLSVSQKLSRDSDGAFDVTVGPLTQLWRQARKDKQLPPAGALNAARERIGYQKLHLDRAHMAVTLDQPGMLLDVGGIAKGYAADEALRVLAEHGIRSALVAASGDLAFSDAPPGEPGWKIGVDDSLSNGTAAFTKTLLLSNAAVSTSGASSQNLMFEGKRYSHIVDPKTGVGLTTGLTTTVIAPQAIDADGLATAVNVLGAQAGLALIERRPGASVLIVTGENPSSAVTSKRFPKTIRP